MDTGSEITIVPKRMICDLLNVDETETETRNDCMFSEEIIEYNVANGDSECARLVWVNVSEASPSPKPSDSPPSPANQSLHRLPLYVTDNSRTPALLGRSWIKVLYPALWQEFEAVHVCSTSEATTENKGFDEFRAEIFESDCFSDGVGTVEGEIQLDWKAEAVPKFHKARDIPFSIKTQVDAEIDRLQSEGIWKPINSSKWASPTVPVRKTDSTIRLCGDYKNGVNPALDCTVYPIPGMEECLEGINLGLYTKLDVRQAYNSLQLCEADQLRLAVNTHRGLFAPTRLPFGISSASGIWQKKMETILKGIPGVKCRVDDILITAPSIEEHKQRVRDVVQRLSDSGLKCRKEKCRVLRDQVDYLGYRITASGIEPMEEKTSALSKMPPPENYQQLRSFIGAAGYYRRFIQSFSDVIQPLLDIEENDFKWEEQQQKSFDLIKTMLTSPPTLKPYDQSKPLILATDSSSYALGAVILQPGENETILHPIEYASRKLSSAEVNYSMIEKEALGVIWGVKRFHRYTYGRQFDIHTDHRALEFIFAPGKNLPVMTVSRIARWALFLQNYNYTIRYEQVPQADVLSRLVSEEKNTEPEHGENENDDDPCFCDQTPTCLFLGNAVKWKTSAQEIAKETVKDPVLSQVMAKIRQGRSSSGKHKDSALKPYLQRMSQGQLTVNLGCVMWGHRVCIPEKLWARVVEHIHSSHPGIEHSKRIARGYVWFPGIDKKLEERCRQFQCCVEASNMPAYTVQPWPTPKESWERVHSDLYQWDGQDFILIVDAYSNWVEITKMKSTTSSAIIATLSEQFKRWGLPIKFVTDNGPQYVSAETRSWLEELDIIPKNSPPYNQRSNGLAECYVGKVKAAMKKGVQLEDWILMHNNTPLHSDGSTPAERFIGRKLRTPLTNINPLFTADLEEKQPEAKRAGPRRSFSKDQPVYYRDPRTKEWIPAVVQHMVSPSIYRLRGVGERHVDHIIDRTQVIDPMFVPQPVVSVSCPSPAVRENPGDMSMFGFDLASNTPSSLDALRRSSRVRHPPIRYEA